MVTARHAVAADEDLADGPGTGSNHSSRRCTLLPESGAPMGMRETRPSSVNVVLYTVFSVGPSR